MIGRPLPPLNALRAFEASRAAPLGEERCRTNYCVTPGAVSQMLKTLEGASRPSRCSGRMNRGINLTEAGPVNYLPSVRNAFRQIAEATRRIAVSADTAVLTVSATPFFASAWLVPRLKEFQDAHPEIDLQVAASNGLADFSRDGVDVAIRHGLGRCRGGKASRSTAHRRVVEADASRRADRWSPDWARRQARPNWRAGRMSMTPNAKGGISGSRRRASKTSAVPAVPPSTISGLLLKAVLAGQRAGLLPGGDDGVQAVAEGLPSSSLPVSD